MTLLHPPYTLWHLSYVVMGAAVMPPLVVWRLALHAGGVLPGGGDRRACAGRAEGQAARHRDRHTERWPSWPCVSIWRCRALGLVYGGLRLVPFIVVGCLLVFSYNLELFGGIMHSDVWFGLAWGWFPALVGAYAQHWTLSLAAAKIAAAAAFFLSMGRGRSARPPGRFGAG